MSASAATPGGPPAAAPSAPPPPRRTRSGAAPRRRARELAMMGLYQWLLTHDDVGAIEAHLREQAGFDAADREHLDALLRGGIAEAAALDALLAPHLDRPSARLSPVEHALLMLGAYELQRCLEVPYRVAINEAVELAKTYGGTDGHRYVNGVLDKLAGVLRPQEAQQAQQARAQTARTRR